MSWMEKITIAGVYESPRRKAPGIHPFQIQAECIKGALDDAGIAPSEVDGLCAASGYDQEGGYVADILEVVEYLGIEPAFFDSTDVGGCSSICHVGHAAAAIACGMAKVVVISYASCNRSIKGMGTGDANTRANGPGQFEAPYGFTQIGGIALLAARHMADYGLTRDQMSAVPVLMRANAAHNPQARYRDPISASDVVASPMISTPFHLLDCCSVCDSGGALVLVSADRARDCRTTPVRLIGFGEAATHMSLNQQFALDHTPGELSAKRAFDMAGLGIGDMDVAQLYDAFSISPILAAEDLGACPKGQGGAWFADGNAAPDGVMPVNTDGGGMSSNHAGKRGIMAMIENVRQLRGDAPGLQLDAPETAVAHGMGCTYAAAATLIMGKDA